MTQCHSEEEAQAKDEQARAEAMEQMNKEMNREEPPAQNICLTCFHYDITTKKCSKGKQPDYSKKEYWRHNLCSSWAYWTNEGR